MEIRPLLRITPLICVVMFLSQLLVAQVPDSATIVPRIVHYSGVVDTTTLPTQQFPQTITLTFNLYTAEDSQNSIFSETQQVTLTDASGRYSVGIGSQTASALPFDFFVTGSASWVGVSVNSGNELPRVKLISAGYAMKAGDADTLGGKPAGAYLTSLNGQIPNSATTATSDNVQGSIVARDSNGGFRAGLLWADHVGGRGDGLFGIPNEATTATSDNVPGAIVARDLNGGFRAGLLWADHVGGKGDGLYGIPNQATTATSDNVSGAIVARDSSGGFRAGLLWADHVGGKGDGLYGIPNQATTATSDNVPGAIIARDSSGGFRAGLLWADHVGGQGDGLFGIPNQATTATEQNVSGAIVARDWNGNFAANMIQARGFSGDGSGLWNLTAINSAHADSATVAATATTATTADNLGGIAAANYARTDQYSTFNSGAFFTASPYNTTIGLNQIDSSKELVVGTQGNIKDAAGPGAHVVFDIDAQGNGTFGALSSYFDGQMWNGNRPVKLVGGGIQAVQPGDNNAFGIIIANADNSKVKVAYAGMAPCSFSTQTTLGDYVIVGSDGLCADAGATAPAGVQIIGTVAGYPSNNAVPVYLGSGIRPFTPTSGGTLTAVTAGSGLSGGTITSSGTISIANAGVTNSMLQNSAITVTPGAGLSGGGTTSLGGALNLVNTGALSFAGRTGAITPTSGDYSFAQLSGGATAAQLPAGVVYVNQPNTFAASQTVNGSVTATGFVGDGSQLTNVNASTLGGVSGSSFATAASVTTESTARQSADTTLQSNIDAEAAARQTAVESIQTSQSSESATRQAADTTLQNNLTAESNSRQSADTTLQANIDAEVSARQSAITSLQTGSTSESSARQSADTTLQNNINSETSARQSSDNSLQSNLNAETSLRQSADAALQSSIDSANATSAKLAAANVFAAKQSFAAATTSSASVSIAPGTTPTTPAAGDLWNNSGTLQYRDSASATRSIVTSPSPSGMQMVKFTGSLTPTSVAATVCTEQSFTFSGVVSGDIVMALSQPTTNGPGTNIAVGGARVSANNTLTVQFCNVGKAGSTPTAGTYTVIVIR